MASFELLSDNIFNDFAPAFCPLWKISKVGCLLYESFKTLKGKVI